VTIVVFVIETTESKVKVEQMRSRSELDQVAPLELHDQVCAQTTSPKCIQAQTKDHGGKKSHKNLRNLGGNPDMQDNEIIDQKVRPAVCV